MLLYYLENNEIKSKQCDNTSFDLECDVLCIGAGCAGIYAAVASAREGMNTILLEYSDNIGGMHVCGGVKGYYYGAPGGTYKLDDARSKEFPGFYFKGVYPETKQAAQIERIEETGVSLICGATTLGVYFEGTNATGVQFFDGEKKLNIKSKIVIDATSDGYIIRMCPVNKRYGRDTDGKMVPFTVRTVSTTEGKYMTTNQDNGYVNQYDSAELSRKAIEAKAHICKMSIKGDRIAVAYRTGIREGLTFEGEETLKYSDIILDKQPERILFYAYSDLDKHGHDYALDEELFQNWWVISNLATITVKIAVPMGCVVPKNITGIVTAGRCFSCDSYSQSAVRMNRDMFRMGECIGIAAAIAVKSGTAFNKINYDEYLSCVNKYGCFEGYSDRKYGYDYPRGDKGYMPVEFDFESNKHLLSTEAPGPAIWSCYVSDIKDKVADELYDIMMTTDNLLLKYNCSIALGIMMDKRCLPVIRDIVRDRDCFYFKGCRRSNQFRSVTAVCLLGRLGDENDIELLENIVFCEKEFEKEMYHTLKPDYLYFNADNRNFIYYQMFTHACMALIKISKRIGITHELQSKFVHLFSDDTVIKRITNKGVGTPAYTEISDFIKYVLALIAE